MVNMMLDIIETEILMALEGLIFKTVMCMMVILKMDNFMVKVCFFKSKVAHGFMEYLIATNVNKL